MSGIGFIPRIHQGLLAVTLLCGPGLAAAERPVASDTAAASAWPRDLRALVDQDGRPFAFARIAGAPVLVNFIFTSCPMQCPAQMRKLVSLQRALPPPLRSRVRFVSVTVDPERDSAQALKRYARDLGADLRSWTLVTGSRPDLERLFRSFGAGVRFLDDGQFDHWVGVFLLDARGRVMQKYAGDPDQARLVREIAAVDSLGR